MPILDLITCKDLSPEAVIITELDEMVELQDSNVLCPRSERAAGGPLPSHSSSELERSHLIHWKHVKR